MRISLSINTDLVVASRGGERHNYVVGIKGLMFAPGDTVIESKKGINRAVVSRNQFDSQPMRDVLPEGVDLGKIRVGGRFSVQKQPGVMVGLVPSNPNVSIAAIQVGGQDIYTVDGQEVARENGMDRSNRKYPWLRPTNRFKFK